MKYGHDSSKMGKMKMGYNSKMKLDLSATNKKNMDMSKSMPSYLKSMKKGNPKMGY